MVGSFWGIEGDPAARRVARTMGEIVAGAWLFPIRSRREKICTTCLPSLPVPRLVTLMERAADLLKKVGVPARIARPMLAQFVDRSSQKLC